HRLLLGDGSGAMDLVEEVDPGGDLLRALRQTARHHLDEFLLLEVVEHERDVSARRHGEQQERKHKESFHQCPAKTRLQPVATEKSSWPAPQGTSGVDLPADA